MAQKKKDTYTRGGQYHNAQEATAGVTNGRVKLTAAQIRAMQKRAEKLRNKK